MQVFPKRKTDAEYIDFIRRSYEITNRWKWSLVAASWLFLATCLAFGLFMKVFPGQRLASMPAGTIASGIAWFWGFTVGHLYSMMLWIAIFTTGIVFQELRTWRLLLAYHDRLQQAGLLPAESSGKMEFDQDSTKA